MRCRSPLGNLVGRTAMTVTSLDPAREPDARSGAAPALIRLDGVSRVYGSGDGAVHALSAVDLAVGAGEFVVVLGPSGSGKTTLLTVIGALDAATDGRVVVGGVDITRADRKALARSRRRTVSFIFQTFNLFPGLTALENVQFGAPTWRPRPRPPPGCQPRRASPRWLLCCAAPTHGGRCRSAILAVVRRRGSPLPGEVKAPLLIAQGLSDPLVLPDIQTLVKQYCPAGQALGCRTDNGEGQMSVVAADSPLIPSLVRGKSQRAPTVG